MRRLLLILLAGMLGGLTGACGRDAPDAPAPAERRGQAGTFTVSWTPVPDPIPLNAMFGLDLRVSPSSEAAEVTVDAGMPGHGHGMTVRPKTTRRADGTFEARGLLFHMPGEWEITVSVRDGATTATARFPVTVP